MCTWLKQSHSLDNLNREFKACLIQSLPVKCTDQPANFEEAEDLCTGDVIILPFLQLLQLFDLTLSGSSYSVASDKTLQTKNRKEKF